MGVVPNSLSVGLVRENFILAPGKEHVGMEPSSPRVPGRRLTIVSAIPVTSGEVVSVLLFQLSQLLLILLLSQVFDIQVSDTLGLVDFFEEVFLDCGFLFDLLF